MVRDRDETVMIRRVHAGNALAQPAKFPQRHTPQPVLGRA